MPSKNTIKLFDAPAYYHVYNRGAGGQPVFLDSADKQKFLSLFERYLVDDDSDDDHNYPTYNAELIAYCLMRNHFHLLLFQEDEVDAITRLMRSVSTAYSMYFNRKYKRQGRLFQSIYKASRITDEAYLLHITRYIHMNPRTYKTYRWSSLRYYLGTPPPVWLQPGRVHTIPAQQYLEFLEGYEGKKIELEMLKSQLAI